MHRTKLFLLMGGIVALACGLPFNLPLDFLNSGGASLDEPIPAGGAIEYEWGTARVLNFQRPTAFQVVEGDIELGDFEDRVARAASGAEFIAIEMEFTCASGETTCEGPPEAVLALVLDDGRLVEEGSAPWSEVWLGDEEIAGGGTVSGWITFEVPVGAGIQALRITPFESETDFHAALPSPVDGYTLETEWIPISGGAQERFLPNLYRTLEEDGFDIYWAGLYEEGGETGLYVTLYTDSLFFFDDNEVIAESQDALLAAVDLWNTYGSEADYLGVDFINTLSDDYIATAGADTVDIEDYLNGTTDEAAFMSLWWVVNE